LLIGFALLPTLLAYLLFNYGLKSVESHRAGVLILSEPLAAILMGAVILGQNLQLTDLLGGILIVFSFLLVKKQEN